MNRIWVRSRVTVLPVKRSCQLKQCGSQWQEWRSTETYINLVCPRNCCSGMTQRARFSTSQHVHTSVILVGWPCDTSRILYIRRCRPQYMQNRARAAARKFKRMHWAQDKTPMVDKHAVNCIPRHSSRNLIARLFSKRSAAKITGPQDFIASVPLLRTTS